MYYRRVLMLNNKEWDSFYKYSKIEFEQKNNKQYPYSYDDFVQRFKISDASKEVENYIFFTSRNKAAGRIEIQILNRNNVTLNTYFWLSEQVTQPITGLIKELTERFNSIRVETDNPDFISLFAQMGFLLTDKLLHFRLPLNKMQTVKADSFFTYSSYSLEIKQQLSEVEFTEFVKMYNQGLADMMRKNTDYVFTVEEQELRYVFTDNEKYGKRNIIGLLKTKNNQIIGFTWISVNNKTPVAEHIFTGIKAKYRKQGLAFFMKLNVYNHLSKQYPEVKEVITECYACNTPIIKINRKLGFLPYKEVAELILKK